MRGATSVAWQPDLGHPWSYTTQNTDRLTHNELDKPDYALFVKVLKRQLTEQKQPNLQSSVHSKHFLIIT